MKNEMIKNEHGTEIIRFGNWILTPNVIYWGGEKNSDFYILIKKLNTPRVDTEMNKYEWPIHLALKQWLAEEDLRDFDLAFVYALEYFNLADKDSNLKISKTLEMQKSIIESRSQILI